MVTGLPIFAFAAGLALFAPSARAGIVRDRAETLAWFLKNEYGVRPAAAEKPDVSFAPTEADRVMLDGKAVRKMIRCTYRGPCGTNHFDIVAFVPLGRGKAPSVVLVDIWKDHERTDPDRVRRHESWPVEELVDRGYAAISFYYGQLAPETYVPEKTLRAGVFAAYERYEDRTPTSWGALSAWAWGASRVMDWIEREGALDAARVMLVGHSRGGKTALVAGVTDSRFAAVVSNDSGTGGARLNGMNLPFSEPWQAFDYWGVSYWFCGNYRETFVPYNGMRVEHDQDEWLSLIAPRILVVGSGADDKWAGPEGERAAAERAAETWKRAGVPGNIDYWVRPGGHGLTGADWRHYLDFADRHRGQIVVCDQADQSIKIYDGEREVWKWTAADDPAIPAGDRGGFACNVAECKACDGGRAIAMVSCGSRWAVVDRMTKRARAWGRNPGWGHSIEVLPDDRVAVVSTGGDGGSAVFLYDVKGAAGTDPAKQRMRRFAFDMPHGLHWDGGRLWVVDTPGLHRCKVGRDAAGEFTLEVERSWLFKELGVIHGHDLRPVTIGGVPHLVLTTQEKVLFFDLGRLAWDENRFIDRRDVKTFDPNEDASGYLVTVARTRWWTDTIEIYDAKSGFRDYRTFPGAKIYKARWCPPVPGVR